MQGWHCGMRGYHELYNSCALVLLFFLKVFFMLRFRCRVVVCVSACVCAFECVLIPFIHVSNSPAAGAANPFAKMFGPDMWAKLGANPKTRDMLTDPAKAAKIRMLQQNPQAMMQQMLSDPDLVQVFGVLSGIDLGSMGGAGGPGEDMPMPPAAAASAAPKAAPTSAKPSSVRDRCVLCV
jgi:hypothetical protein